MAEMIAAHSAGAATAIGGLDTLGRLTAAVVHGVAVWVTTLRPVAVGRGVVPRPVCSVTDLPAAKLNLAEA